MKYNILGFLFVIGITLSCGSPPANNNSIKTNANVNVSANSNISNSNVTQSNNSEMKSMASGETYKQIEEQQKEDKKLAEEKLKNAGKSEINSNASPKQNVPKGKHQTF